MGVGSLMLSMLVYCYSRSYTSVYDIKENAHMLYWKSVDHVQTHRSEARTQRKDDNDRLKHTFAEYRPFCTEINAF